MLVHDQEKVILINDEMAKRIFTLKEERWPDGELIKVFIHPVESIQHRVFVEDRLKMPLSRYRAMIEVPIYGAKTLNLIEVTTEEKMVASVLKTKGGVGYLNGVIIKNGATVIVVDDVLSN